jgi:hypothetical protein
MIISDLGRLIHRLHPVYLLYHAQLPGIFIHSIKAFLDIFEKFCELIVAHMLIITLAIVGSVSSKLQN